MSDEAHDHLALSRRNLLLGSAALLAAQACRAPSAAAPFASHVGGDEAKMDQFVADCVAAEAEGERQAAVQEVLARGVSDPRAMLSAAGEPVRAGIKVFHRSSTLTIFAAAWTPQMNLMPHNHEMWALIGLYTGREDNILWRRSDDGVTAYGADALFEGDVGVLPETAIHSVTNPLPRFTSGIHIYGGDFFETTRSQWDPETREESPSDGDRIRKIFERANERYEGSERG